MRIFPVLRIERHDLLSQASPPSEPSAKVLLDLSVKCPIGKLSRNLSGNRNSLSAQVGSSLPSSDLTLHEGAGKVRTAASPRRSRRTLTNLSWAETGSHRLTGRGCPPRGFQSARACGDGLLIATSTPPRTGEGDRRTLCWTVTASHQAEHQADTRRSRVRYDSRSLQGKHSKSS